LWVVTGPPLDEYIGDNALIDAPWKIAGLNPVYRYLSVDLANFMGKLPSDRKLAANAGSTTQICQDRPKRLRFGSCKG
jgi:hypothetical protein